MKRMRHVALLTMVLSLAGFHENLNAQTAATAPNSDDSAYCRLLHVPQTASIEPRPGPYLGIYYGELKITNPPFPYPEATYIHAAGVIKGSPAELAGLKKGDVLLSLDDQLTCRGNGNIAAAFKRALEKFPAGAQAHLKVLRGENILTLAVKMAQWPEHQQPQAHHPEVPSCTDAPSLLHSALSADGGMAVFQETIAESYRQSNRMHNPGSPWETPFHPFQLKEATYMLRYPLTAGIAAKAISARLIEPVQDANWQVSTVFCRAAQLSDVDIPDCMRKPKEISFPALVQTLEEAAGAVRRVTENLSAEEKTFIRKKALNPEDGKEWNGFLELSLKLDRAGLYHALAPLASFMTKENLDILKNDLMNRFDHAKEGILYQARTSAGLVIVGGRGSKVYNDDAALILDLGGHNLYTNNAGGTRPDIPVALVIDWGGHNRYIARENFSQGAGILGGGFLIDLGGHSTLIALDGSQGAGFAGVGLLYHGEGCSVLRARENSQGTGQTGIGLLVGYGPANYSCLHKGQGLGLFGGVGVLINRAGGNVYQLGGLKPDLRDPEKSTVSLGQGFGFGIRKEGDDLSVPGGIGVLIDERGGDSYIADHFAQGSAYHYGVGILDNRGSHNLYVAGRYAQGAGIHTAVGVLQNRGGNNSLFTSVGASQGMGHDHGVGFLKNGGNENDYNGGVLVQGAATRGGWGILVDGGKRSRMVGVAKGQGYADDDGCLGLLFHAHNREDPGKDHPVETVVKIGIVEDSAFKTSE